MTSCFGRNRRWNATLHQEIAASTEQDTVNFGHLEGTVSIFDPLSSASAIATYWNVTQIQVNLTDHPLIIEVDDGTSFATPAANLPMIHSYTTGASAVGSGYANVSQLTLTGTGRKQQNHGV